MSNERGITTIELLIALLILAIVMTASASFYEFYITKTAKFGEANTARNLAVSVLETQMDQTKWGDIRTGEVYKKTVYVEATKFEIIVSRKDITDTVDYYNKNVPFFLINSKVIFNNKSIEVNGYVTTE